LLALSMALATIDAGATIALPSSPGGSELVFFMADITEGNVSAPGGTTSFSQDLGVRVGDFDARVSQAFNLDPAFAIFRDPARYDPDCGALTAQFCGAAPDFDNRELFTGPPNLWWGVLGAEATASDSRLMTTYALNNDLFSPTDGDGDPLTPPALEAGQIAAAVARLEVAWADNPDNSGPNNRLELNSLQGHATAENGAHLILIETLLLDPSSLFGGFTEEGLLYANGARNLYLGSDPFEPGNGTTDLGIRSDPFEQVPMYLFSEVGGAGDALGNDDGAGLWYIDWDHLRLIYEAPGSPVPAPVPVPATVWLLGSALLGISVRTRRRGRSG